MTHAIILAAGQGTRLRPLTQTRPKCLVPLLGKTLLARHIHTLQTCGIHNIHVVAGFCSEMLVAESQALGFSCTINENYAAMNMVGTLFSALPYFNTAEDLIIAYGDIVYQPENLLQVLHNKDKIAVMVDTQWKSYWALRFDSPLSDAETLKINQEGYITELGKKPLSYKEIEGQYTGLIKIRADFISTFVSFYQQLDKNAFYDGKNFSNMYFTSFLQALINNGFPVKAITVNNGWLEVDSVSDLQLYESLAAENKLDTYYRV